MKNQDAKRFKKSSKIHLNFTIIFIIFIVGIIFLFYYIKTIWLSHLPTENPPVQNTIDSNANTSVEGIIEYTSTEKSKYASKTFDTATHLTVQNLFLIYENNITIIKFNLHNNSLDNQDLFDFTFSLLDENGIVLISYELSSGEIIEANTSKEFVLIATRNVSNAFDFKISM